MANFGPRQEPKGEDSLKNTETFLDIFSQAWRDAAAKIHYGMGK